MEFNRRNFLATGSVLAAAPLLARSAVAQAPAKAGTTRVTLRAVAGGPATEFWVDVPDRALAERRVDKGAVVQVNERVYGYEFAYGDTNKPFFLALQDEWYRELSSRKVTI